MTEPTNHPKLEHLRGLMIVRGLWPPSLHGSRGSVGVVIGVLSGVGTRDALEGAADRLILSIADLLPT
jgi:hypothetical protein